MMWKYLISDFFVDIESIAHNLLLPPQVLVYNETQQTIHLICMWWEDTMSTYIKDHH